MGKRFIGYLLCIIIAVTLSVTVIATTVSSHSQTLVVTGQPVRARLTVVLVPLDSRPPCTQFVDQLAGIADIRLILPPTELLDNYKTPADKAALRAWLKIAVAEADAAIISTDMLIHGGLLASRSSLGTADDVAATFALLETIHKDHPEVKLYGFSIIPRLLIADSKVSAVYQKKMLKYSVLKDEVLTFENPADISQLSELEKDIPAEVVQKYLALNEVNMAINQKLIDSADTGVLSGLVLGQDDGQPFGLPNIAKDRLVSYLSQRPRLSERVFITRGTDEVALTLLGHISAREAHRQQQVLVKYSAPDAAGVVMPFMPHSVARTVQEKLAIVGAVETQSPEDADFILYVHIGTQKTKNSMLLAAAKDVNQLLAAGEKVALVDLSEDYYGHETLLPYLIKEGAPVNRLIAYAGWNTTSNSIGTAVTEAVIFNQALAENRSLDYLLRVYKNNLEFLCARFLDDWYFQKDVQTIVKNDLGRLNIDANNLAGHYQQVNGFVKRLMTARADTLQHQTLMNHPLIIDSEQGPRQLRLVGLELESRLPWQRTFDIWLKPTASLVVEDVGR